MSRPRFASQLTLSRAMNRPLSQPMAAAISTSLTAIPLGGDGVGEVIVCIAEEEPIAFRYDGFAHGVMMATPDDLEDFACGFSLAEGVIEAAEEIDQISVLRTEDGLTLDISLSADSLHRYLAGRRVRQLRGNTSCGLCGVQDLDDIRHPAQHVAPALPLDPRVIAGAPDRLRQWQPLSRLTRGAHAAAWFSGDGDLQAVREDVGRHNALDKLVGAGLRGAFAAEHGFCLITSRCSYEMVQKAVAAGFSLLVSVSSPTARAVRAAQGAGLTLYALSRDGTPLLFASPNIGRD